MKIQKVVDFRTFHKLNEAEEKSAVLSAADQIVNLFFSAFGAVASKISSYSMDDLEKELLKVAEAKAEEKGKNMQDVISGISSKVDPKFQDAAGEMVLAAKKIRAAYDTLLDADKAQTEKINDKIYKKIFDFIKSTASTAAQSKEAKGKVEEGEGFSEELALYEKGLFDKTFIKERNELISKLTPTLAMAVELAKNSPTPELKSKCTESAKDLIKLRKELSEDNEKWWESQKRKDRVDRLKEISERLNEIPNEIQQAGKDALIKLGLDKKVQDSITAAAEAFSNAVTSFNKPEEQKIEASGEKKAEASKEGEKEDNEKEGEKGKAKEEIVSGTVDVTNLKKAGKNREAIRDAQKKINMLLPNNAKIKDDGLYGKNTEEAIKKISSQYAALAPDIKGLDGKKMTPAFRKFLDNYEKNKEKIAAQFK